MPDDMNTRHNQTRLARWLADPASRGTAGFPIASDEAILALSDPPAYTACPNPFVREFVDRAAVRGKTAAYPAKPYCGPLEVSGPHPLHRFHPYHTKVPPQIIRTLIEHYTRPGELVLDAFAGSGMTGVAAREAGRNAILADLSPLAAFVAGINTTSQAWAEAALFLERCLEDSERRLGRLFRTLRDRKWLHVNYFVRSDLFTCPHCGFEFSFFRHGVIHHGRKVETRKAFPCPQCKAELNVRRVCRVVAGGRKKSELVWVNAGEGAARINADPTLRDLVLALRVERMRPGQWHPRDRVDPRGYSARLAQLGAKGLTDVSRFLSKRNLAVFSDLWGRVSAAPDLAVRNICRAALTSIFTTISERQGYFGGGGGMSGNFYMPIVRMEKNPYDALRRRLSGMAAVRKALEGGAARGECIVSTQSATSLAQIPDNSIDYVFTDPPFGSNIIYSELNVLLEAWLQVRTDPRPEAVIDESRSRGAQDYFALVSRCFSEYFRVLKPGRWLTVEFHNTRAEVWNGFQEVLGRCGFVVQQAAVLNKGSTTILSDIRPGAAKFDLLISAVKPIGQKSGRVEIREAETDEIWDQVRQWLEELPRPVPRQGRPGGEEERLKHMLYDRMVARQVSRRAAVPMSVPEFCQELARRFPHLFP